MLQSLSYSVNGSLSDRSRVSYIYTASKWTPSPSDLEIDYALDQFAVLTFSSGTGDDAGRQHIRRGLDCNSNGERPLCEKRYNGTCSGYAAPSEYGSAYSNRHARRMIEQGPNDLVSTHSQRSKHQRLSTSSHYSLSRPNLQGETMTGALVPYPTGRRSQRGHDIDGDVGPEDSISQVSSRVESVIHGKQRGRTRKRDNDNGASTRYSGSTIAPQGQYSRRGDGGGSSYFGTTEEGLSKPRYQTRVITPG